MPKSMTHKQVMKELESHADEKVRLRYERDGAGDNVFGTPMGPVRALAKTLGTQHDLGLELWETGNYEARVLACMVLDPKQLTEKAARGMLESLEHFMLADEFVSRVLVYAPVAPALQARWMESKKELPRRSGWKLLGGRIGRGLETDLDEDAVFARIEKELPAAPLRVKEGMNFCLVWMGIHLPKQRKTAIAIGERLGRWDPRPVPKGCTSSYAPEWIAAHLALKSGEKTEARKKMDAVAAKKPAKKAAVKKPTKKKTAKDAAARS